MAIMGRRGLMRVSSVGTLAWIALVVCPRAGVGQTSAESDSSTLVLRIELNQSAYVPGDSIKVRLTVRNTLPDTVRVRNAPLVSQILLSVYNSAGQRLTPGSQTGGVFSGPPTRLLTPWAQASFMGSAGSQWIDIRDWGYNLHEPGRYTIAAMPRLLVDQALEVGMANPPSVIAVIEPKRPRLLPIAALAASIAVLALAGLLASRKPARGPLQSSGGA
jgi:hypothetical protein